MTQQWEVLKYFSWYFCTKYLVSRFWHLALSIWYAEIYVYCNSIFVFILIHLRNYIIIYYAHVNKLAINRVTNKQTNLGIGRQEVVTNY